MMKNITIFFLLLFFWSCTTRVGYGINSDKELFAESGRVSVRVFVTSLPDSPPCKAASSWRWGAENACPRNIIGALEVKVSGEPVFIPLSVYADLGNPRTVRIESRKESGQFVVILIGGDAATSYSATLEFRGNLLTERIVRHGEFPDESWEKTSYKFNIGN